MNYCSQTTRRVTFSFLLLWLVTWANAQAPDLPTFDDIVNVPMSPEAAAIEKYGNNQVALFTGTPNIGVPITTLSGHEISIPVSLSYDASGVKVEQLATNVGLGWNLNAGGMVVRQVKGKPDDFTNAQPYYYPFYSQAIYPATSGSSVNVQFQTFIENSYSEGSVHPTANNWVSKYYRFMKEVREGHIDSQPDTYSFNINGLSGTLFLDYAQIQGSTITGYCIENPEIKVYASVASGDIKSINSWTIVDGNGTNYVFGQVESTFVQEPSSADNRTYNSAWGVTAINTKNNRDVVFFNYSPSRAYLTAQPIMESEFVRSNHPTADCGFVGSQISYNPEYTVTQADLTSIVINESSLLIDYESTERTDLSGRYAIDKFRVIHDGQTIKTLDLEHSYFGNVNATEFDARLRLDAVADYGRNALSYSDPQKYTFDYNNTMPSRKNKGRDYWGYYNGRSSNTLIPANAAYDNAVFTGANRSTSTVHSNAGTIKKVHYPTGGHSEYFFQNATASKNITAPQILQFGSLSFSNGSGIISTTPYTCDDVVPANDLYFVDNTFTVDQNTSYDIDLSISNNNSTSQLQLVAIYEGSSRTACNVINDINQTGGTSLEYFQYSTAFSEKVTVSLESGKTYHMLLASEKQTDIYMSMVVSDERIVNSNQTFALGSQRVYKIIDRTDATDVANTRYFYYNDGSSLLSKTIVTDVEANVYQSSGVLQQPVAFDQPKSSEKQDGYEIVQCEYLDRYATNRYASVGSPITYSTVTELQVDAADKSNGLTVTRFYNNDESTLNPFVTGSLRNGKVEQTRTYKNSGTHQLVEQTDYHYTIESVSRPALSYWGGGIIFNSLGSYLINASRYQGPNANENYWTYERMPIISWGGSPLPQPCGTYSDPDRLECLESGPMDKYEQMTYGGYYRGWLQLTSTVNAVKDDAGNWQTTTTSNEYQDQENFQITRSSFVSSDGITRSTEYLFPNGTNYPTLLSENRLKEPLSIMEFENTTLFKETSVVYNNNFSPTGIFPEEVLESIKGAPWDSKYFINEYDADGNVIEAEKDGVVHSFIWGYSGKYLIAKIVGATYTQVESAMGGAGFSLGDGGKNLSNSQVSQLRSGLPGAQVSHFKFQPGVGLIEESDANDVTTYYTYDSFNRLFQVIDEGCNVVQQQEYKINQHIGAEQVTLPDECLDGLYSMSMDGAFGNVYHTGSETKTVSITNNTNLPMTGMLTSSAPFYIDGTHSSLAFNIAGNATANYDVEVVPTSTGNKTGSLNVIPDVAHEQTVALTAFSYSRDITVSHTSRSFGNAYVDDGTEYSNPTKTVTITNTGNQTVTGTLSVGSHYSFNGGANLSLAQGASRTVTLTFDPTSSDTKNASFVISGNHTSNSGNNYSVALSGTGVTAVRDIQLPSTQVFTSALVDGGGDNFSDPEKTFTVTNSSSATHSLTISSVSVSGDFSCVSCPTPLTLSPGQQSAPFKLKFDPTASGTRNGTITFNSNDTNGGTQLSLQGSATMPKRLISSASSLTFTGTGPSNEVWVGEPKVIELQISNLNTSEGTIQGSLSTNNSAFTLDKTSINLAKGTSTKVEVTFSPSQNSSYSGKLTITSNATNYSPKEIDLNGTGLVRTRKMKIATVSQELNFGEKILDESNQNHPDGDETATIYNTGNSPLTISGLDFPSTDYYSNTNFPIVVAPGGSSAFRVKFDPQAQGNRDGTLTIHSDKTFGENTISLKGSGTPATRVPHVAAQTSFNFGSVFSDQQKSLTFTLTNNGNSNLDVDNNITGDSRFIVSSNIQVLTAGSSETFTVTYDPNAVGYHQGTITIGSNLTSGVETFTVDGTGLARTRIIQLNNGTNVKSFGTVKIGKPKILTIQVKNIGNSNLTISNISSTNSSVFSISDYTNFTLAPNEIRNVSVTFSPTSATSYSETLTFSSDKTGGTHTITVTGTGESSGGSNPIN